MFLTDFLVMRSHDSTVLPFENSTNGATNNHLSTTLYIRSPLPRLTQFTTKLHVNNCEINKAYVGLQIKLRQNVQLSNDASHPFFSFPQAHEPPQRTEYVSHAVDLQLIKRGIKCKLHC